MMLNLRKAPCLVGRSAPLGAVGAAAWLMLASLPAGAQNNGPPTSASTSASPSKSVLESFWPASLTPRQAPPSNTLSASGLVQQLELRPGAPLSDAASDAAPLALTEAVRQATSRHPAIADAVATLAQQVGGIDVARAGYYPRISAGVGGGRNNGISGGGGTGVTASASVSQMLYDFGKVDGTVDQAEALLRRQQAVVLKQIDSVAQQTADAVVQVHRYQALAEIAQEQVTAVGKVLEMARLRASAGISTRADPIQATSRYDSARSTLLQVKSLQTQWRERLRTLTGAPVPAVIAPLPERIAGALRFDVWPDADLLPDVLAAQADRKVANAQLAVARAQRYPTISLDASTNKALNGVNANTLERNGTYHTLMINLSSVIYQGGALDAQVRAALAAEEAARQRIESARLTASDQVRSFREMAIGAQARLGVLADRKRSIVEARDLYREQYTLGTRSILDLLNAEQEIYLAAADEQGVLHDLWQNRVSYIGATGQSRALYDLNNTTVQGMELLP